jgi:hypothetical protein
VGAFVLAKKVLDLTHCMASASSKLKSSRTARDGFSERAALSQAT